MLDTPCLALLPKLQIHLWGRGQNPVGGPWDFISSRRYKLKCFVTWDKVIQVLRNKNQGAGRVGASNRERVRL